MSSLPSIKQALSKPEAFFLVMKDAQAKDVLAAWTLYPHSFTETVPRKGETLRTTLFRWWTEFSPDMDEVARTAGIPVTRVTKIFRRLQSMFLVWPDGTVAPDALNAIRGERNVYVRALIARTAATDKPKDDKGKADDGKRNSKEDKKADRKPRSVKARR